MKVPTESDLNKFFFDSRLEKLAHQLKKQQEFNLFDILQHSDYEIKHSNVLAWLLNPKSSHGLGQFFLNEIVKDLKFSESVIQDLNRATDISVEREKNNFDILILSKEAKTVILIENKVWSPELLDQLQSYQERIAKEYSELYNNSKLVLLSPYYGKLKADQWVRLSYKRINGILALILNTREFSNKRAKEFIEQYKELLEKSILKGTETDPNINALLTDHKDTLQYLKSEFEANSSSIEKFRNRGEEILQAVKFLISRLSNYPFLLESYFLNELLDEFQMIKRGKKESGYFITRELQDLIKKVYTPYEKGGNILFYNLLLYSYYSKENLFSLNLWLYPGEADPIRDNLVRLIKKSKHIFNDYSRENNYYRIFEYNILDKDDFISINIAELKAKLRDGFMKFLSIEAPRIERYLADNLKSGA